jgi:peptidoglycan/LPS O-acetylase OafA/YrhL
VRQLAGTIFNFTVGSGIFALPAVAVARLGAAAPLAYLVCMLSMGLTLLCLAEAGSRVPLTGGVYSYVEMAPGPLVGFVAGALLFLVGLFGGAVRENGERSAGKRFARPGDLIDPGRGGAVHRHQRTRRAAERQDNGGHHHHQDTAAAAVRAGRRCLRASSARLVFAKPLKIPQWVLSTGIVGCLALVLLLFKNVCSTLPILILGVAFVLVMFDGTLFGLLLTRPAKRLGDISYSIYLLQGPIFFLVFASASVRSFATESAWSYWTVVIIAALALTIVATATHVLIERPGIRA